MTLLIKLWLLFDTSLQKNKEIAGVIYADEMGSALSGLFGGIPNTEFKIMQFK